MNYSYAQTLFYLEYFKKIVAFLQILRLYIMLVAGSPCCQLKKQVFRQRRVVSESGQHRVSHVAF